ncbi:MAG: hypothetical protein HONBIEJF_01806 [Fimbriimonadaceae bacterium]|nr:hypothetical protein [Fimbriimonadaceae bacterium]
MQRGLAILVLAAFSGAGLGQYPGAKPVPKTWLPGFKTIQAADARKLVYKLAGPDFMGRNPSSPYYNAAAGWIAAQLESIGVKPAGENGSFFQAFTMGQFVVDPESAKFEPETEGPVQGLTLGKEFQWTTTGDIDFRAKLAFVRSSGELKLTERDWAAMNGAIVVLHPDSPSALRTAINEAITNGKLKPLVQCSVASGESMRPPRRLQIKELETPSTTGKPETMRLTKSAANKLAEVAGAKAYLAEKDPEAPTVELSPMTWIGKGRSTFDVRFQTVNVLGQLAGSDPKLKSEAVVIGSHLDHMGGDPPKVLYGADDNASGCAANLMIAKAMAANPVKPKRTVIFAFWSSEETGLHGSKFYTARPHMPMSSTIAYLNMDMVGRDANNAPLGDVADDNRNSIYCASAKLNSPDLYKLLHRMNEHIGLNLRDDKEDRSMRSDTGNFIAAGVPTLKAWTGEHEDYHKEGDTPDKLNYPKMSNITKWLYLAACELATTATKPTFSKTGKYVTGRVTQEPKVELSPQATIQVRLFKVDMAGKRTLVDETLSKRPGQLPFRYCLRYETATLDNTATYTVEARVFESGQLAFASTDPVAVLTAGKPAANVNVAVQPAAPRR